MKTHGPDDNPIFMYAARGQACENASRWADGVFWYQRALACLPNIYGVDKTVELPGGGRMPASAFQPKHAVRIYTSLARCLESLGRANDSALAIGAANALTRGCICGSGVPEPPGGTIRDMSAGAIPFDGESGSDGRRSDTHVTESVSLLMVTHCSRGLKKFAALAPPSCKLLTATYGSMVDVFGESIRSCPKILCYDVHVPPEPLDIDYSRSVEAFSRSEGFDLHTFDQAGLFSIVDRIIGRIKTRYLLFAEHDWLFRGAPIRLDGMVTAMDRFRHINSMRFNKRPNLINGQDFIMAVPQGDSGFDMLRTSQHTNNPCIIRTATLRDEWLPLCREALRRVAGSLGGSSFGIEEVLFRLQAKDIRNEGFDKAHEKWGTFVYGNIGDAPRVVHLGE
jgi:hypothetical protein